MAGKDFSAEAGSAGGIFDGYISEAEYARQRGVSLRTCQRDRALCKAPPHLVLGSRVLYRVDAVRRWLQSQESSPERRFSGGRSDRRNGR